MGSVPSSNQYSVQLASKLMRLVMISLTAMTISSACVAVLFVHALIAPTKPALPDWTTTVADASHIEPTRRCTTKLGCSRSRPGDRTATRGGGNGS